MSTPAGSRKGSPRQRWPRLVVSMAAPFHSVHLARCCTTPKQWAPKDIQDNHQPPPPAASSTAAEDKLANEGGEEYRLEGGRTPHCTDDGFQKHEAKMGNKFEGGEACLNHRLTTSLSRMEAPQQVQSNNIELLTQGFHSESARSRDDIAAEKASASHVGDDSWK